jgi:hypothetical protein
MKHSSESLGWGSLVCRSPDLEKVQLCSDKIVDHNGEARHVVSSQQKHGSELLKSKYPENHWSLQINLI